jgi:predicted HicB family RNase H-like nuclease
MKTRRYSKPFTVSLEETVHQFLTQQAEERLLSMGQVCRELINNALRKNKSYQQFKKENNHE